MDREERRRVLHEALAQCQQPPADSAPALTAQWLDQMRSTGRDIPVITDRHYAMNSLAFGVRQRAPPGSTVPSSVSVGGLTNNLIAGSFTSRGWDPTWAFEGTWSENLGQDRWALLYLVRPVASARGNAGGERPQVSCEVEGQIVWTVTHVPAGNPFHPYFVKRSAAAMCTTAELLRGWYCAESRQLHMLGVDGIDLGTVNGLDPLLGESACPSRC